MKAEELAQGLALLQKATPAPWTVEILDGYITGHLISPAHRYSGNTASRRDSIMAPDSMTNHDAELVAFLRAHAAELLELARTAAEPRFPMQHGPSIDMRAARVVYAGYSALYGTSQSLARMGERHGFGWNEVEHLWTELRARQVMRHVAQLERIRFDLEEPK